MLGAWFARGFDSPFSRMKITSQETYYLELSREEVEALYFACLNYRSSGAVASSKKLVAELEAKLDEGIPGIND